MPSYNTGKFIHESIESVLAQTYTNWELLIIDDCSTDDTELAISKYLSDKRLHYHKNKLNSGAAVSRNLALREAKGRWIAFLDSDDLWEPTKLEKQISFMEEHNYHFTYTNYCEIDEKSMSLGKLITGPKQITKTGMYNYCWMGCLTVMYDASVIGIIQVNNIKKNNDYAIWLKVCQKADCYLLDECLAKYRKRAGSISNHSYRTLIKWHFKLFHEADGKPWFTSWILTLRNIFWGVWKKLNYVKYN